MPTLRFPRFLQFLVSTAVAAGAFGQSAATLPAFEVASVKVSDPLPSGMMTVRLGNGPDTSDPGRVTYKGVTLKALISRAYDVKDFQVEGPQWLDGERYDVMATIPEGSDKATVRLMLQRLLAERFQLTLHHESKSLSVYTLSVAKGGKKLEEVDPEKLPPMPQGSALPPPPPPPSATAGVPRDLPAGAMRMMMGATNRRLTGNITIDRLCTVLTSLTDRPVIDLTDLKGTYGLDLSWTPDESDRLSSKLAPAMAMAGGPGGGPSAGGDHDNSTDPGQTLAQALQNGYGLKLEAKKNPADILVIDHADKVPTAN